jgi:hypothetical protein
MQKNFYNIFTHKDLDGLLSLLVFHWFHPNDYIWYKPVSNLNVDVKINDFLNNSINPSNIFVFDISLRDSLTPFNDKRFTFSRTSEVFHLRNGELRRLPKIRGYWVSHINIT